LLVPQRFGGSLNLSPHLHLLAADGVWGDEARFELAPRPTKEDLENVAHRVAERAARWLRRQGYRFDGTAHEREPDFTEQSVYDNSPEEDVYLARFVRW
jgi:hypothetical protein